MLVIPAALQTQFEEYLRNKAVPNRLQGKMGSGQTRQTPLYFEITVQFKGDSLP